MISAHLAAYVGLAPEGLAFPDGGREEHQWGRLIAQSDTCEEFVSML